MGGALFLRLRASPVVPCSSGLGRHRWCSVPQVRGSHHSRCTGRHRWCGVPQAWGVMGGAVFLRLGASWVVFCASSSRIPPFSMHRASPVVRCSSGLGRHRGPGRTSGGLIKFPGWPGQHIDHGWTMLRRWWGVILPVVCYTLRTIYRVLTLSNSTSRP